MPQTMKGNFADGLGSSSLKHICVIALQISGIGVDLAAPAPEHEGARARVYGRDVVILMSLSWSTLSVRVLAPAGN
jgi:hypothetical protein